MDHLQAIDAGLAASKSFSEIARKVFLTYPTNAFSGQEELEFEILNAVAQNFQVPIINIHVAGSAKIGHSLHKGTAFNPKTSDLDLAIIDGGLFAKYLEIGLKISNGYQDGTKFERQGGTSVIDSYKSYLSKGIWRPDLSPTGTEKAAWMNFFNKLSNKHNAAFNSISGCIYLSQGCFENKQQSVIYKHKNKGV